jgi:cell division septation protein DedD
MAHNEDGEFELSLGNKELLSVLFIVVVLLGVFFAMGYVVGRNSAPVDTARKTEPYVRTDAPSAMPENRRPPEEQVQQSGAASSTAAPTPVTTIVTDSAAERPKPIEVAPVSIGQPQVGQTYLQVSAVAKAEAEILTELLVKKGFRALVAAGPSEKLFRVLVGPARNPADIGRLKGDLEQAGFKSIVRKY